MFSKLLLVMFLFCCCESVLSAKNDFEMNFENFTCSSSNNQKLITMLNCNLGKNAKRRGLNFEMKLSREIKSFTMNLLILMPRRHYDDFVLLNLTNVDGCDVLATRNQVTLMKLWRGNIDRHGNLPRHCPLRKDITYYVRGFRFDMDMVPAFSFDADMNIWFDIIFEPNKVINGFVFSQVAPKNGVKIF